MTTYRIRTSFAVAMAFAAIAASPQAGEVFVKPPSPTGGVNASSLTTPDGSDSDMYAWDDFTLDETQTITEVSWRGGYALGGFQGKAVDFRISFFDSIASGFQPIITALPEHEEQETVIASFHTNNNAGEALVGSSGGVLMYQFHFTLPQPVTLTGGVKYWFRVMAAQPGFPDWGMTTSGPGSHFVFNQGAAMFQSWPNELTFSLIAEWENLGQGLAGTAGVPQLTGAGEFTPALMTTWTLNAARPASAAWFVVGTSAVDLPLFGGVLVPNPVVLVPTTTDSSGSAGLSFTPGVGWPAGIQLVTQAWVFDPVGAESFAASNGLTATLP